MAAGGRGRGTGRSGRGAPGGAGVSARVPESLASVRPGSRRAFPAATRGRARGAPAEGPPVSGPRAPLPRRWAASLRCPAPTGRLPAVSAPEPPGEPACAPGPMPDCRARPRTECPSWKILMRVSYVPLTPNSFKANQAWTL